MPCTLFLCISRKIVGKSLISSQVDTIKEISWWVYGELVRGVPIYPRGELEAGSVLILALSHNTMSTDNSLFIISEDGR